MNAKGTIAGFCLGLSVLLLAGASYAEEPQAPATPPLYALNEMDMHLHSGLERRLPLDRWIDAAVANGRKVLLVLDHRELYDKTPEELKAWAAEQKLTQWYPAGMEGKKALMKDLAALAVRKDVLVFHGWEIGEFELDEGLDREAMKMAEAIGWHISPNSSPPPCGETLIKRVRQIIEVQKEFPVPMIVFHPFSMNIEAVQKAAKKAGKDLSTLATADYRFFKPGEQEVLAGLLRGKKIYIESALGQKDGMENPAIREALIADIKPLAEMGVQFTVSTDAHNLADVQRPFDPASYCTPVGVTPENANGLVRDLLSGRARR